MASALLCLCLCLRAGAELPLLPQPQELEERSGDFTLGDGVSIAALPADDPDLRFAVRLAAEELGLESGGGNATILVGLPARSPRLAAICREADCTPDEALGDQGYVLLVSPQRVIIAANAPAGAFYGVQTLLQLAEIGGHRRIPCVRIRDWPALKWRGILTDQSRQAVPKVETYKRLIRELSRYKINFVSMHLEHTFVVEKHPIISEGTGALTAAEVRGLCDYARKYHCLFFPSFEAFAHQHHILKHEEYKHLAERPGGSSFAPSEEGTYELLADIFDEMCPAFTGTELFNAGCDEVGDLGTGKSKALADQIGKPALYARHMNRVYELLKARGKRMMMWGDMLLHYPEAMDLIPKDTIIMDWHYGPQHDYPSIEQFRDKGFEVFVVPALSSWVRLFPDYETALENIEWLIRRGREGGAVGSMTCNWGDDGNENLIEYAFYGWIFAAECSWGAEEEEIDRELFDRAFCRQFFGTRSTAPTRATHLLSQANRAISRDPYFNQRFFHDDPFKGQYRRAWPRRGPAMALQMASWDQQERLGDPRLAARNQDVLKAMQFAARRLWFVATKTDAMAEAIERYRRAYYGGPELVTEDVEYVLRVFVALREALAEQRAEFVELWNQRNRPEGIDYNLRKFDAQLKAYDDHIAALRAAMAAGALPDPRELDLDDRRFTRRLTAELADFGPTAPEWAVPEAPVRIPVRVSAGGHDRVNAPILVDVPWLRLSEPIADELDRLTAPDAHSVHAELHLDGSLIAAHVVEEPLEPYQSPLAFILPGTLKAGSTIAGELYVWPAADPPESPPGFSVTETDAGPLIHNAAYETLLGREGAHLFTWKLSKLGGLDITQPGESGWAGFFDDPRLRAEPFELEIIANGPVVAIIHAETADGYQKEFHFWAGLPYAECVYSDAAQMSWAFDATANFAADSPMPGTAHLSNGFTAPVPASSEQLQVPEGGQKAWWCCKTRADGLTLGLITPAEQTNMMVGPGGGWGGVGIERSNPAQYFVTFADVDSRGPAAVEEVYYTLARDDPTVVTFGRPEARGGGD
jgi:hexosaminidase